MRTLRVLYVGNYLNKDRYGRSYNTETHIARELQALGHEVTCFQEPIRANGDTLRHLDRISAEYDLLLWTRTWGLPPEATKLWRAVERRGTVTASFHLDRYVGLRRERKVPGDPFWTTQWVFTPDGNPTSQEWFAELGINHVYSAPGVVRDECADVMPGRYRPEMDADVVFVGSIDYHREWPHRVELIQWLERTYGRRFARHGGDARGGPTRGQDLNDLYASAKVVVGDSAFASRAERYWSDRPYESWGRGAYMIFPRIDALADQLGTDYPSYEPGAWTDLRTTINAALNAPDERAAWKAKLTPIIAAEHTYRHRLAKVLKTMGLA